MTWKNPYVLAACSALLLWLAWPPHQWLTPLLLVGFVPLLIALERVATTPQGRRVFLTAGLTCLLWNTASIYWVFNAISAYNTGFAGALVSLFVALIPYGLGALLMTFAFWLYHQLRGRTNRITAYAGLICFYLAMEYLHQCWDLAFPWMTLGNGLAGMHQLAQWYEFTGVYGGSFWILISNILAYEAWRNWPSARRWQLSGGWLAVVILPAGLSLYLYTHYQEKSMPVNVVVVQPNINPYEKYETTTKAGQLNTLIKLSESVAQVNTEYFIWPETAVANYADEDRIRSNPEFLRIREFLRPYRNGTLITGMETVKWYDTKRTPSARLHEPSGKYLDYFNAAVQIENSAEVKFYHKSKLVPGVERMPFPAVFSFLAPVFEGLGGSASGWGWQDEPEVFYAYSGSGAVPVVCYESLWGDWIGRAVKDGAQFIAIITNDGWWGNTSGKDQHLLYAKLRAIETRRWVARSANTGISAFINQRGDIVKQAPWWTRTALKADLNLNDTLTAYVNHGDWIAKLASLLAAIFALIIPYHKWKTRKNHSSA